MQQVFYDVDGHQIALQKGGEVDCIGEMARRTIFKIVAAGSVVLAVSSWIGLSFWRQHMKARTYSEMAWVMSWLEPGDLAGNPSLDQIHNSLHKRDSWLRFNRGLLVDSWATPYRIRVVEEVKISDVTIVSAGPDRSFESPDDLEKSFTIR